MFSKLIVAVAFAVLAVATDKRLQLAASRAEKSRRVFCGHCVDINGDAGASSTGPVERQVRVMGAF